ncbi:hypothetical protein SAMN05421678_113207 [Actinopolymorpha cephalotaxi]|uniref:Uncharacterized protein n=1 Tax=Actinopolymorpha cephalotaxi TaxID=504797 RepID=A0A1I2Y4I4_9ACTN|nr:hypothetical protein [Actinopolymorpha cephalotaxi]NYH87326.1 hypothetical protein [Actinopolymorpha cephalotaxi]SFH20565.1 hypothetical protein SAMN05421678_113207 [Actinopolymorpha cephalotaxi]
MPRGSSDAASVFFVYPGKPALAAEVMTSAAKLIGQRGGPTTRTWQDLEVDGRLVIDRVLEAISSASVIVADVGSMNSNVLFEVGYALASNKQLLLCLDTTDQSCMRNWQELGILSGIGFTAHDGNSENLAKVYLEQRPELREDRLWEELLVAGGVGPRESRSLFYLPVGLRSDAEKTVDRLLSARRDLSIYNVAEEEQGLAPLSWYSARIYRSSAALVHLRSPSRVRATVHNARASLMAGMAHALNVPTLLIADELFEPPFDYQDLLMRYSSTRRLSEKVDNWLDGLPIVSRTKTLGRMSLTAELPVHRFGEYVAENEQDELAEYFVETGQYRAVLASQTAIFVGRKGTGKTANMLQASAQLRKDRRNLVTVIKPSGYELESLIEVLSHLPRRDVADYLLDGLWRYMLLTEIAVAAVREAEGRAAGIATGSPMEALRAYLDDTGIATDANFAIRLEHIVNELMAELASLPSGVADAEAWLGKRLYASMLNDLRREMGHALKGRKRVAVLIDNLDKAWERNADREQQSRVILGLLGAVGRLERELRRDDAWRDQVNVTLAVFLRADIFDVVRQHAREPDKISTLQVRWDDPELLARIVEDRYVAMRNDEAEPHELWSVFFTPKVKGRDTRTHLLWRSLPRPRDLVYLCNSCVLTAINRRRSYVSEEEILAAEVDYSRFAFDALMVEGSTSEELDNVLLEFASADPVMPVSEAKSLISSAAPGSDVDEMFSRLLRANFLGLEVEVDRYDYPAEDQAKKRALVMARKLEKTKRREPRVSVHPAFRPYLEIKDD